MNQTEPQPSDTPETDAIPPIVGPALRTKAQDLERDRNALRRELSDLREKLGAAEQDAARMDVITRLRISVSQYGYRGRDGWEARVADPGGHYQEERTKQIGTGNSPREAIDAAIQSSAYAQQVYADALATIRAKSEREGERAASRLFRCVKGKAATSH